MVRAMSATLGLQDAAERLGVHYMTAYRYVRLGLLPAEKIGGTWTVTEGDLVAFRAGESAGALAAAGAVGSTAARRAPYGERLEARLVAGDGRGAWGVVESAMAAGAEVDEVYLDVIAPAMQRIGARWAAGELDVAVEHRATGIVLRMLGRLGPKLARRGRSRGTVLIGGPTGEMHSLPLALLGDLLRGEGWEVSDLGADTPTDSFVRAALETDDLVAVGVSVSTEASLPAAAEVLAALQVAVGEVYVMVGGVAVRDLEHARELGADGWAASARRVAAQLDALPDGIEGADVG
mgnify:CR=1 FL=1|jgi:excisionase family DNA binding protein